MKKVCQENKFICTVCIKKEKKFDSFKELSTHCLKKGDEQHIKCAFNESNIDDWVECKVEGCFFRASRIDFHLKKHDMTIERYKQQFSSAIFSNNFLKRTAESGRHANDGRNLSGENNPFFGKKHTQETRDSISKTTIKNNSLLEKHFNKDREMSLETRKKMSIGRTGEKNPMYGKRRNSILERE